MASAKPSTSIILINYNGWNDLTRCMPTVIADALGRDYEILVVDNCSTDGSAEKISKEFPQIRLIRNNFNSGFGAGNNIAARQAKGKYLAFLNIDTVVEKNWLEELIKSIHTNPHVGMVTSKILLMSEPDYINACGNDVHITGLTLCRGKGMKKGTFSTSSQVSAVSGAAFVMSRDLFQALGGFDDSFFMYMEDTDLSLRVQLAGYIIQCVPQSVVYHDYVLTFGPLKTFYQERNRYMTLLKNFKFATLFILSPAFLLAEIVTWGFVLIYDRKRFSNKLSSYQWILQHLKEIWRAHNSTQTIRRIRDRELISKMTWRIDFEQTGHSWVIRACQIIFDPLFFIARFWALAIVWW